MEDIFIFGLNETNKVQYVKKLSSGDNEFLEGNDYDCGPFLIYALEALCNNKIIKKVNSEKESIELGQKLRKIFDKNESLDEIFEYNKIITDNEDKIDDKGKEELDEISFNECIESFEIENLGTINDDM